MWKNDQTYGFHVCQLPFLRNSFRYEADRAIVEHIPEHVHSMKSIKKSMLQFPKGPTRHFPVFTGVTKQESIWRACTIYRFRVIL